MRGGEAQDVAAVEKQNKSTRCTTQNDRQRESARDRTAGVFGTHAKVAGADENEQDLRLRNSLLHLDGLVQALDVEPDLNRWQQLS